MNTEHIRQLADVVSLVDLKKYALEKVLREAADTIDTLRSENKELRSELNFALADGQLVCIQRDDALKDLEDCRRHAREIGERLNGMLGPEYWGANLLDAVENEFKKRDCLEVERDDARKWARCVYRGYRYLAEYREKGAEPFDSGIKCSECGSYRLYIADIGPYVCADCGYVEGDTP